MMENKRKLILDCDPGTDDSVCIMMALTPVSYTHLDVYKRQAL